MTGWGPGAGTYALAGWLFLRVLALVYLAAFASLAVQVRGMVGPRGILPAGEWLETMRALGRERFFRFPTIFWWIPATDRNLRLAAWGGVALSLLLLVGVTPIATLVALWALYLSFFTVCPTWLGFQWDLLLVETGLLAVFVAPRTLAPVTIDLLSAHAPSPIALGLLWWLLFRLIFSSGLVKLTSGDPTWRRLTALAHHYETQPLPVRLAWWAHHLPLGFHRLSAASMFVIELGAPFLIFGPAPLRHGAALAIAALMLLIVATGNYGFFNVLTIALCLPLFDDAVLQPLWPSGWTPPPAADGVDWPSAVVALPIALLSAHEVARLAGRRLPWPRPLARLLARLEALRLLNPYGLFAVMTTSRPEIIIEGSHDGRTWRPYEFRWKPGDPRRPPRRAFFHMPRLDWMMWFAALGTLRQHPWFLRFAERLLEGSSPVRALLRADPFGGDPPRFVRAVLYDYRFADPRTRRETGAWWVREPLGVWCPPVSLGR